MTIRTKAEFSGVYLVSNGTWPDNNTGDITPEELRDGVGDFWESQIANWPLDQSGIIGSDSTGLVGADFASGLAVPTHKEGRVFYDADNHTFAVYNDKPDVTLQLGQETHIRAVNKTGSTLPNGTVVAVTGAQGNRPTVEPAIATHDYTYIKNIIGITTHETPDNEEVLVTTNGTIGTDTTLLGAGSGLYLSPTISGGVTNVMPNAPDHIVNVGYSLNATVNGKVLVAINAHPDLEDLSNVNGTPAVSGSIMRYDSTNEYWDSTDDLNPTGVLATKFVILSWTADSIAVRPKNIFGTFYSDAIFTGSTISSAANPVITEGYNRHAVMNVTAVGTSGVVNIIGNKINENTGVVTSGFVDAIDVTATGYYQSPSKFIDEISFVGVGSTSVTATSYSTGYADFGNAHVALKYVRFGWIPSNPSWDIALNVFKVNNDGSLTDLDQGRLGFNSTDDSNRAANGVVGHAKVIQDDGSEVDIRGDQNEGIVIQLTNKAGDSLPSNVGSADFYIGMRKFDA